MRLHKNSFQKKPSCQIIELMFGSIKKILKFGKKKPEYIRTPEDVERDFNALLDGLKDKLQKFLITRSVASGEVKSGKDWKLIKNNNGLFRLESDLLSILINTESFLAPKDGKVTGLIRMSEASLCRVLADNGTAGDFFSLADPIRSVYLKYLPGDVRRRDPEMPGIDDLSGWDFFDVYQMVARNSPDTLVHVLIHASPEAREKIKEQLSVRKKEMLISEMKSPMSGANHPSMNPHSRIRSLLEYEDALLIFRKKMHEYILEKKLRERKKLQLQGALENSEHES